MDTKKIDSQIDNAADKAKQTVGRIHDKGAEAGHTGPDGERTASARLGTVAKAVGDRVEETADKAGHAIEEVAAKAAHVAHEVAQKAAHKVKEAATKVQHRGQELVDKAADTLKGR